MSVDLDARVANLGVATKQMVEIAKALTFDSRILILDEPTAALTNKEVDTLFETIRKLQAQGVSMLYISHRLDEIFQIADRVTVIRDGEHVHTEDVAEVTKDELVAWMVGRTLTISIRRGKSRSARSSSKREGYSRVRCSRASTCSCGAARSWAYRGWRAPAARSSRWPSAAFPSRTRGSIHRRQEASFRELPTGDGPRDGLHIRG